MYDTVTKTMVTRHLHVKLNQDIKGKKLQRDCVFSEQLAFGAMAICFFGTVGRQTNGLSVQWDIFQTIGVTE